MCLESGSRKLWSSPCHHALVSGVQQNSCCRSLCWSICVRVCYQEWGSPWSGTLLYISAMNGALTKHGASTNLGLFLASAQTGRHQLQSQCAHCWVTTANQMFPSMGHTRSCNQIIKPGLLRLYGTHLNHQVPHYHSFWQTVISYYSLAIKNAS